MFLLTQMRGFDTQIYSDTYHTYLVEEKTHQNPTIGHFCVITHHFDGIYKGRWDFRCYVSFREGICFQPRQGQRSTMMLAQLMIGFRFFWPQ